MILFLKPYFEEKPWAGNELLKLYDCSENTGEAWIVSGYEGKSSIIKNTIYEGKTLDWLWNNHPELFGNLDCEFPVLIKLISSKDKLSVQVHPDDEYANLHYNSYGKFECWYILPETKNNEIVLGTNAKNKNQMIEAIDNDIERILCKRKIEPHNLVLVDPGTVHAICEDTFLLEIQESSNITYRLFDYNREPKRELHIKESLDVIKYNQSNVILDFKKDGIMRSEHFNIKKVCCTNNYFEKIESFVIVYVVCGQGMINDKKISKGDSCLITIDSDELNFEGNVEIIIIYPNHKK